MNVVSTFMFWENLREILSRNSCVVLSPVRFSLLRVLKRMWSWFWFRGRPIIKACCHCSWLSPWGLPGRDRPNPPGAPIKINTAFVFGMDTSRKFFGAYSHKFLLIHFFFWKAPHVSCYFPTTRAFVLIRFFDDKKPNLWYLSLRMRSYHIPMDPTP